MLLVTQLPEWSHCAFLLMLSLPMYPSEVPELSHPTFFKFSESEIGNFGEPYMYQHPGTLWRQHEIPKCHAVMDTWRAVQWAAWQQQSDGPQPLLDPHLHACLKAPWWSGLSWATSHQASPDNLANLKTSLKSLPLQSVVASGDGTVTTSSSFWAERATAASNHASSGSSLCCFLGFSLCTGCQTEV